MGLDMYATLYRGVDAEGIHTDIGDDEVAPLFQWRKHPNLHGWMEQLYRAKGGAGTEFNGNSVRLEPSDLDALEKAVNAGTLPYTTGFFFGRSQPKHSQHDHDFLKLARSAIANGYAVFYSASW